MEPRARASGEQFSALLEFIESHGDLSKPQPGAQGRIRADRLWQELSNLLNSIGSGVNKTPDKWKKGPPAAPGINDGVEDGTDVIPSQLPSSPQLPLIIIPSPALPTNSQDQPTVPDADTYAPSVTPPPHSTVRQQSVATTPQSSPRRRESARRRRTLTPFDRAAREFAAIEQRRIQLEERLVMNEGRRIEADNNRTNVLNRFADIAESFLQHYLQSRGRTE